MIPADPIHPANISSFQKVSELTRIPSEDLLKNTFYGEPRSCQDDKLIGLNAEYLVNRPIEVSKESKFLSHMRSKLSDVTYQTNE